MLNKPKPRTGEAVSNAGRLEYFDGEQWKPLEFTREDARGLRDLEAHSVDLSVDQAALLRSIADRIDALLPPHAAS